MSKSEARKQKQLARKKAKRDEKRSQLARRTSDNPLVRLAGAEAWPVVAAFVPEQLWEHGIGQLVLARRCPDGRIACAVYLVDTYCLGVKNAFWNLMSEWEYDKLVRNVSSKGRLMAVAPEALAKIVLESVAYAQSFGLPAHPDFRHARMLLAGIDASQCADTFHFGKDGKPLYINGPHDSPEKIKVIIQRLEASGGKFIVGMGLENGDAQLMVDAPEDFTDDDEGM